MSEQETTQEQNLEQLGAEALEAAGVDLADELFEEEELNNVEEKAVDAVEEVDDKEPVLEPVAAQSPGESYEFDLTQKQEEVSAGDDAGLLEKAVKMLERAGLMVVDPEKMVREDKTQEEALSTRDKKKAHIAQILRRGRVNTKMANILDRYVPKDRAGKFVRNTPDDISAHESLGFELVRAENPDGMHGSPDGTIRVGDVVLMSISREDQGLMRELRAERVKENTGGRAQEEFLSQAAHGYDETEIKIGGRS